MVDQIRLVIEINDLDPLGQRLIDLGHLRVYALNNLFGVFVNPFQHDPGNDLALAVLSRRSLAKLVPDLDPGDIADPNWRSTTRIEHDILAVIDIFNESYAATDILPV